MSEIKAILESDVANFNARDFAHQLIDFHPEKDFINLVKDLNYYKSALKNPTKDANEALESLRVTLSETRHLIFGSKDIGKIREVFHEMSKIRHVDFTMAQESLIRLESQDVSDRLFALVVSKDLSIGVVVNLPKNVKQ